MKAVPVTKVEQLIDTLKPFMDQLVQLDDLTLQRYKRLARDNMHAYPWAGFVALGMIGVLEWNEDALDENYGRALGIRNDFETRASYATALQLLGKYDEALQEGLKASESAPEHLLLLSNCIDYAQAAGRYEIAMELIKKFKLRSNPAQQQAMGIAKMDEVAASALEILAANEVPEEVVASSHGIAFRILRENRVPYTSTRIETDTQDKYVMYFIDVAADEEEVDRLDRLLGVALFDEISAFDPDKYWVGYRKAVVA